MPTSKTASSHLTGRAVDTRRRVLAAAERLLRNEAAEFSMRELAAEAGVSFATPFNQFGSKAAIMQTLSGQRIDAMAERFAATATGGDAVDRTLAAFGVAVAVMLEEPRLNRAVIGTLGSPCDAPGQVYDRSRALWAGAIGDGDGLAPETVALARALLPGQLAVAFRGVLSFWTAGELPDGALARRAREAACASLVGFVHGPCRTALLAELAVAREGV